MSEEEKNLVERDYEGEERVKMMAEINKRLDEMETKMNTKIEGMNSRIEEINSELQGLRARLYDQFHDCWRNNLYKSLYPNEMNELNRLAPEKYKFEREIKAGNYEHWDRFSKIEPRVKELEENMNKIFRLHRYF